MNIETLNTDREDLFWGAVSLCKRMYNESGYTHIRFSHWVTERSVGSCMDHGFAQIAIDHHRFVGLLLGQATNYTFSTEKIAQDIAFYVVPESRDKGVGKELLKRFVDWAAQRATEVQIGLSFTNSSEIDPGTIRLLEKAGFAHAGSAYKLRF